MLFADLLSLHLVTFLMFFFSCSCHFFLAADACLSWSLPSFYHRAASLPSYAVLAEESQAFFKHSPHTNSISNSAILRNIYISLLSDLYACVHVKKKWRRKGSHSSSVGGSNRLMWLQTWKKAMGWCTVQWKMLLFCAKTIVKESRKFELAHLKKKKKEKHFGGLVTFWFGTFAMLLAPMGVLFVMKTLENEQ